ncbi:hypothetical protein MAR_004143 [Mya arenaria]|uniref:Uncharacterized protein n=1 Tax=Mya arenaria TaxID=6604 RepID=A0ABY7EVQ3_MYAAR|nr:hypothetical protein MAR_004143 [Mya arenaria]
METKWRRRLTFISIGLFYFMSGVEYGIGGGVEAVILAEVTRNTETKSRTGTISILVSIRQTGLLVEDCDKKSINSAFGSRSPTSDPDDLIETAEEATGG